MENTSNVLLTSTNYFQWKSHMEDLWRSKGFYRITIGTYIALDDEEEIFKWDKNNDQALSLIGMSISPYLIFHLDGWDSPVEAWKKVEYCLWHQTEIRSFQLGNELLTLNPNKFPSIEDYLSKFNTLRLLLVGCKVTKEDGPLIYGILVKLPPVYSVFVSTFHSTKEALISARTKYKAPSLDVLCDFLLREQEKPLHLSLIKTANSSNKALVAQQSQGSKNPKKEHPKKNGFKPNNKGPKQDKATQQNDKSNKGKGKKIDRHCNFCNRDGHIESKYFKKMKSLEAPMKKLDTSILILDTWPQSTSRFILLQHHLRDNHLLPLLMHL